MSSRYVNLVDWNNDGDFSDTGEDVTARVRDKQATSIARGRDQIRALAPPMASAVRFTLDNTSQDYSPENSGSPLVGLLLPGRPTQARANLCYDAFTRADDATALGDLEVGVTNTNDTWVASPGYTFGISSNRAYCVTDTSKDRAYIQTTVNDAIVSCIINGEPWLDAFGAMRSPGLLLRYDGAAGLAVFVHDTLLSIYKFNAFDVLTLLASTPTAGSLNGNDHLLVARMEGDTITAWFHRNVTGAVVTVSYTLSAAESSLYNYAESDRHGLYLYKLNSPTLPARWDNFAIYKPLGHANIDDMPQHPQPATKSVEIVALGTLAKLRGQKVSTQLYSDITTDVALGYVLDAVGLTDTKWRVFSTGQTTLAWWWLDNEDAFDAAVSILNTEGPGASLWEDGQGRIHFEDRHYRLTTTRCITSQATISDTGSEPLHSPALEYNPGLKDIINSCTIEVKRRTAKGATAFWTLGETVTLTPGEVRKYVARDSAGNPFTGATSPLVAATDYTVSAGSLSGDVTLDRTSGATATVTMTAGASGATVTGLQVRGQLVSVDNVILVANTISTSTSQTRYGTRTYTLATRAEISVNDAQDFVNAIASQYQAPRPTVTLVLYGKNDTRLAQILNREISDRITVVDAQTSINSDYLIERIEHLVHGVGPIHRCRIGCEKAVDGLYARWGSGSDDYTHWATDATTAQYGVWGY